MNEYVTVYKDEYIEIKDNRCIRNIMVNGTVYNYGKSRHLDDTIEIIKGCIVEVSNSTNLTEYEVCKRISVIFICWMYSLMSELGAVYDFKSDFVTVRANRVILFNSVELDNCTKENNFGVQEVMNKLNGCFYNYFGLLMDIVTELNILFLDKEQLINGSIHTIYGDIHPGDCIKFRGLVRKIESIKADLYSNSVIIKFVLDNKKYITTVKELYSGLNITKEQISETNDLVAMLGNFNNIKY